jgi:hypothetical protein
MLARCLLPVFQREQKPGLRFRPPVKVISKHKEHLMNRKSTLSLLLTTLATLIVTATVMLEASSAQAATAHNNKVVKTTIKLRTATQIGNTTLSPRQYRVKITPASDASGDPTVQFSILYNPYGDETNLNEEEVVLTVQASMKDLGAPAANTELTPTSDPNNKASALKIRGNSTEYVFGDKITSGE